MNVNTCKGRGCQSTDSTNHSPECLADYELSSGVRHEFVAKTAHEQWLLEQLEAAKQRIADLEWVENARDEELAVTREKHGNCLGEKEALEKKLEEQHEPALKRFNEFMEGEIENAIERLRFFCSLSMKGQDWLDVEQFFDAILRENEELTKREASARQQGFEEGKQAGRDELQKGFIPKTVQPLDTVNYWVDAYAASPYDPNLSGGMIVQLLREYQEIRRRVVEELIKEQQP